MILQEGTEKEEMTLGEIISTQTDLEGTTEKLIDFKGNPLQTLLIMTEWMIEDHSQEGDTEKLS